MKQVISVRDLEEMLRNGKDVRALPTGALLTPSARDLLRELEDSGNQRARPGNGAKAATSATPVTSKSSKADIEAFFNSPAIHELKLQICDVGRRLWQRAYVDGNGGNIAIRVGEDIALCTPTLVSKGFMKPEDMCLVDLEGNQLCGTKKRTSEILMHLEIYKAVPEAKAVVHCHPPHATAYAITGRVPPTCIIPEFEVFVGKVGLTKYETPGTQKFAETVLPFVKDHNTVLLGNHGIVCWADTVTHAEWYAEVLDTYCWTLLIASQLGAPITTIAPEKAVDLLAIKQRLGMPDARLQSGSCPVCDLPDPASPIVVAPPPGCTTGAPPNGDTEALVHDVTAAVLKLLDEKAAKK